MTAIVGMLVEWEYVVAPVVIFVVMVALMWWGVWGIKSDKEGL